MPHPSRQTPVRRAHKQVIVVWHQAESVNLKGASFDQFPDDLQEFFSVLVVHEDGRSPDASRHDVVERSFEFDSQRTAHAFML
jgi:hypothetical protein